MRFTALGACLGALLLLACKGQTPPAETILQPDPSSAAGGSVPPAAVGGDAGTASPAVTAAAGMQVVMAAAGSAAGSGGPARPAPSAAGGAGAPAVLAPMAGAAPVAGAAAPVGPSGIAVDPVTGELVFRTEPVELDALQESYTCFAATLAEDVVVNGFVKSQQPYVHHAQFVETFLPEPDGLSECKEQFKLTWLPIFLAGNGASELRFDEGVGHVLAAGTQLVLQMHLFNTSDHRVKQAVEIRMIRSTAANPTPVSPWAIGSADIKLAPRQAGKAQKVCTQTGPVKVLAVFPHMHTLGTRMTIEVGKSLDAMRPLYARDPFSFDDQRMEKKLLSLDTGDLLRVTCDYMNTTDREVGFGESSTDEMCFFVGFALGESPAGADCPDLWEHLLEL